MKQVEDWNIIDGKVVYDFTDGTQETVERSKFEEYVKEMDYNIFHTQIAEDEFVPYTPSDEEYIKAEKEFFDDYFKDK